MNEKHRFGKLAEMRVAEELVNLGYVPCQPVMDERYDYVVEIDEGFKKVQVKKAYKRKSHPSSLVVELRNVKRTKDGENERRKYTSKEVDIFAVWSDVTDDVYWFEYDDVGSRCIHITMKERHEVRKANRSRSNFAQEHLIQNQLESNMEPILDRDTEEEPDYESATSW